MNGYMMQDYFGSGFFFPGFGILLQFIILIIFLIIMYWVVKSGKMDSGDANEILKKRLAKGEITKKEYNDIRCELEK